MERKCSLCKSSGTARCGLTSLAKQTRAVEDTHSYSLLSRCLRIHTRDNNHHIDDADVKTMALRMMTMMTVVTMLGTIVTTMNGNGNGT